MQEELFIKHTGVVTWLQNSLSDFLGTLSVQMKSQTMHHSGGKNQLIHSNTALNYIYHKPPGGVKYTQSKKRNTEHLLDFRMKRSK